MDLTLLLLIISLFFGYVGTHLETLPLKVIFFSMALLLFYLILIIQINLVEYSNAIYGLVGIFGSVIIICLFGFLGYIIAIYGAMFLHGLVEKIKTWRKEQEPPPGIG